MDTPALLPNNECTTGLFCQTYFEGNIIPGSATFLCVVRLGNKSTHPVSRFKSVDHSCSLSSNGAVNAYININHKNTSHPLVTTRTYYIASVNIAWKTS